jgi:Fur family peroxide stress response transcriptional regulator
MGYRMTPQRAAILEVLEGNREHLSAEDVHRRARERYPSISLATVYNTLELFLRQGRIREVATGGPRKRFDPDTAEHSHIICDTCARVADVGRLFPVRLKEGEKMGYEISGARVEFHGRCPECRKKEVRRMAEFKCEKCGATKEGRCRPKKCPACGESGCMQKQE